MKIGVAGSCGFALLFAIAWFPGTLVAQKTQASDIGNRRSQLLSLFDEEWQYELRTSPEMANLAM